MEYPFKTEPYAHQLRGMEFALGRHYFALHMEQRTGKTKLTIDIAGFNYLEGRINALAVIAPNGVHTNWAREEIPLHMSEVVPFRTLVWRAGRASTVSFKRELEDFLHYKGLAILCINVEATITKAGKAFLRKFLEKRRALLAVDESTDIKTPGSKRTKAIKALGRHAKMRSILTGTPGKPMEQYSQFTFLSPHILNAPSYLAFKHEYGEWMSITTDGGRSFEKLTGHKNLDCLRELTAPHVFRVTRAEVFPDMPPKQYTKRFIELSPEQARMYKELRHNYITFFDSGHSVTAAETLVRYLRLQQIVCGYVPVDEGFMQVVEGEPMSQPEKLIPGPNPRLATFLELWEETDGQMIVWCRFKMDVRLIREALRAKGVVCAEYHGGVRDKDKPDMLRGFQSGEYPVLLGNARSAGRGLDMSAADVVVYYSNYFGLETRQQSEDRPQHPKRKKSVQYVDLVAEGTIDERIIRALRSDQILADMITGDPEKDWI